MRYFLSLCAVVFLFGGALFLPSPAHAQDLGLEYGASSGLGDRDVRVTAIGMINVALSLLGVIALVLVVYAGFKWMTSGGNQDDVESAKKILYASVIGLLIILTAYSITNFVLDGLYESTTGYNSPS